jgi:hypothetical protein
MNKHLPGLFIATAASACLLFAVGCGYSGGTRTSVHYGYYSGGYWHDPYYHSSCCRGGTIVAPPAPTTRASATTRTSSAGRPATAGAITLPTQADSPACSQSPDPVTRRTCKATAMMAR